MKLPTRMSWIALAGVAVMCRAAVADEQPFESHRFEVDHIFVMCEPFAPEMTSFERAGFQRWPFTVEHTDQGTRGRYIRFDNCYIELLWVFNEEAAKANIPNAHADFVERSSGGGSPIGVGLRDLAFEEPTSVETRLYSADWMGDPEKDYIEVFTPPSAADEPWVFRMPPHWTTPHREGFQGWQLRFLEHDVSARVLTRTVVTVVGTDPVSEPLQAVAASSAIEFVRGEAPLVELIFDEHAAGETVDFRPELPVVIRY